ncbi:MAG: hypothetical protein IT349_21360 [Candidatus Eisenbacteria bacterium]|nr:hypothetical protein [Candidatus Eisenbacteria bacterium]
MTWARVLIPSLITGLVGLTLVAAIFIPAEPFATLDENFSTYFDIVAAFAFILGGGNLLRINLMKVQREHGQEKFFAGVTLFGFLAVLLLGALKVKTNFSVEMAAPHDADGTWFKFFADAVFNPCVAAMFSLLGFFVASASYRAFRARTKEATLLLGAAFIILLGRTPFGPSLTAWLPDALAWLKVENLSNWIMSVPNLAGQRAILIGIALGIISTSLKLILGLERSHLSGEG